MSKLAEQLLHQRILEIVLNTSPWDLYLHMDNCRSGSFGGKKEYITFYHRQIVPYIRKKIGFAVSAKDVKIALSPLRKDGYYQR